MVGNKPFQRVKTFNCPNCGSDVKITIQGQTLVVVCNSCSSLIDTSNENYQVIQKNLNKQSRKQVISLGVRGTIDGIQWEVTGYVEKKDGDYKWSEYLLFNPYYGYRWLTEIEGHWTLYTPKKYRSNLRLQYNRPKPHILKFMDKEYRIFNAGKAEVIYVLGEFYWKIKIGDTSEVVDYIAPPYQTSVELEPSEINWTHGVYIEPKDIRSIFKIYNMPLQFGIGSNQVNPHETTSIFLKKSMKYLLLILIIVQTFLVINANNSEVHNEVFVYKKSEKDKLKKTPSFEIKKDNSNLEITFQSPVNNNWIELAVSLVHEESGESVDREAGIEYYFGSDSDGSWTEGSQDTSLFYNSLPKGKYHLIVEAGGPLVTLDPNFPDASLVLDQQPVSVSVKSDVVIISNFIWSFLLLLIIPIVYFIKNYNFEFSRWSNSNFSPYE